MKLSTILTAFGLLLSINVQANDGGIAAIKVDSIKMREVALKNDQEVVVQSYKKPSHKIIIEGGEAAKLQKILPSESSVFTGMYPDQAKAYNESFKALGIYSQKSATATSKVIEISCSDAEINEQDQVVKTGKTVCVISINGDETNNISPDYFGDAMEFNPKTCN